MNDYGWTDEEETLNQQDYTLNESMLQCSVCKFNKARFRGDLRCAAFGVSGPPDEIVWGMARHTFPVPGDGGKIWAPDTEEHRIMVEEGYAERDAAIANARKFGLPIPPCCVWASDDAGESGV